MSLYPKLDKIVVAMTVADRKNKNKPLAKKWISRGFRRITKQNLIKYWENRLSSKPEDLDLYKTTLTMYERTLGSPAREKVDATAGSNQEIQAPGVWQMMKTAAIAGKNFVKSGMKFVTEEQFEAREAICKGCEYWNPKGYGNTGQCLKCGCATKAKLRLASESCPLQKWVKIEASTQEYQ
jgi:hypothetical protein